MLGVAPSKPLHAIPHEVGPPLAGMDRREERRDRVDGVADQVHQHKEAGVGPEPGWEGRSAELEEQVDEWQFPCHLDKINSS